MKLKLESLDKFILFLMGFSVLVDMINGFFIRELFKIPVSQVYKISLILLILIRLSPTKDILPVLFVLFGFQLAPVAGWIKTGDTGTYIKDVVVASKWIVVPLSFFFFKNLFQGKNVKEKMPSLIRMVRLSFVFLSINMLLGAMGYGSAFYYEGYPNAAGTKGYIYAGNELTILVLVIGFMISLYLRSRGKHFQNGMLLVVFLIFAFLITSKTVVGGVAIVFLIPYLGMVPMKFHRKWADRMVGIVLVGLPLLLVGFYYGVTRSGFLATLQYNKEVNEDLLTILLSNRNNFVIKGWEVFVHEFSGFEKIVGLGESYHLALSGNLAELDFITILFSNGVLGLLLLLFLLLYYFINNRLLLQKEGYGYARSVFVFLVFICIAASSAGHIFNSGIAGIFIGAAIALMFCPTGMKPLTFA